MADVAAVAQSFGITNVSGMLFEMGENRTPLVNSLPRKSTNSVRFAVNSQYTLNAPEIPAISETASMTAPLITSKPRVQEYNVTQIFQKSFGVSYGKLSNTGTLTGINVSGQASNIQDEWDFQTSVKVKEARNDLELTLLTGVYNEAKTDAEVNKTRGLLAACPAANKIDAEAAPLTLDIMRDVLLKMYDDARDTGGLVALMSPVQKVQLGADIKAAGQSVPSSRTEAGWDYTDIITEVGVVPVVLHPMIPAGKVLFFKPGQCAIVEQPVPGKGNAFTEELARTGAAVKGQFFAQFGLDYGNSGDIYVVENLKVA